MTNLCDFVFQHRYGKKWITYSDSEIVLINKALRRKQKTVTLPNKDPKKHIVINFETLMQKNTVSNAERKIRALIFTQDFHAWMWLDDDDEFTCFKAHQVYFLEAAFQQKLNTIRFYDDGDYLVDLKQLRVINEKTSESKQIIREKVLLTDTPKIKEIAFQNEVVTNSMQSNENLKCLCKERRIFDPSIASLSTPSKSRKPRLSSDLFLNTKETDYSNINSIKVSVDKECPDAEDYKVYSAGTLFFSAVLLNTSIESNTNKYLLMQILKKGKDYFLWLKSSRIGYKTQTDLKQFQANIDGAKTEFEEKFYEKTKNNWQDVTHFKHVPGKYDLLKMDLSLEVIDENSGVKSYLSEPVQDLLTLITSRKMMNQIMEEMEYDLQQAPLGKLTTSQIRDGYAALSKVAEEVARGGKGKDLIDACDEFYMKIPHNFGRKKPPIILTQDDVEDKMKMLEALLNINIAQNILDHPVGGNNDHPLDRYYKSLGCELKPLDPSCSEFEAIQRYLHGTCGPTHNTFKTDIISVFACKKVVEEYTFANMENKYLLWHGSRLANWIGILKEGLRIAPAEAPCTGAMFGKGLYFADMSSKSVNYCYPTKKQNMGILVLCEVSLGNPLELFHAVENMPQYLPVGYQSVVGKGKYVPTDFKSGVLPGGAKLPVGPVFRDDEIVSGLAYNEYVVYSSNQVKMKYLILVKCNFD